MVDVPPRSYGRCPEIRVSSPGYWCVSFLVSVRNHNYTTLYLYGVHEELQGNNLSKLKTTIYIKRLIK